MAEQRCGTCKWWERWKLRSASANPSEYGDCNWPLPVLDENLSSVLEVLRKAYPDKRFRAVKVTETREVVA